MLGFIEYKGSIKIDEIEVAAVAPDQLRSRLVTITQDQVKLDGTIRDNLYPLTINDNRAAYSTEEEEKAAEQDVELEQLLTDLGIWAPLIGKGGLRAVLDEVGYSKGQLQLLCIARAITRQRETGCKLVLVDEPTSSVDAVTEATVNRVMGEYFAGCTVITIAHRQTSLDNAAAVLRLHHGAPVCADRAGGDAISGDPSNSDSELV